VGSDGVGVKQKGPPTGGPEPLTAQHSCKGAQVSPPQQNAGSGGGGCEHGGALHEPSQ
jgi:hypothetical protein